MDVRAGWFAIPVVFGSASLVGGCAAAPAGQSACVATPFIRPATATLDHTAVGAANSQTFTTGIQYVGQNCAQPAYVIAYAWQVSDTADSSISSPGGTATCLAAGSAPITVSSYLSSVDTSGKVVLVPSGLPSASLICK